MKPILIAAMALFCAQPAGAAAPADCRLVKAATLEVSPSAAGPLIVPVEINGEVANFAFDTARMMSLIDPRLVTHEAMTVKTEGVFYVAGRRAAETAIVSRLSLGGLVSNDQPVLVAPDGELRPGVDGLLGIDLLHGYDIELDLGHGKVNLFQPHPCSGVPVYWSALAVVIPIHVLHEGLFTVPMTLDGKPVEVLFDPTEPAGTMSLATAHQLFGLERDSPGMEREGVGRYRYPFATLQAGGMTIAHPGIVIVDSGDRAPGCTEQQFLKTDSAIPSYRCIGKGDLRLGAKQLQSLRLIVSFGDEQVSLTPSGG
jgi:hypothetical protein